MRISIREKMMGLIFLGIFTVAVSFLGIFIITFRDNLKSELISRGHQISKFFARNIPFALFSHEKLLITSHIDMFFRDDKDIVFAAGFDKEGNIVAGKSKREILEDEIQSVIKHIIISNFNPNGKGELDFLSDGKEKLSTFITEYRTISGEDLLIFSTPVFVELGEKKTLAGFAVTGFSLENMKKTFADVIKKLVAIFVIILGLTFALTYILVSRGVIKPLSHITKVTENIAQGDLTQKPKVTTSDEIQIIAQSFSHMVDVLKADVERLKVISQTLFNVSGELKEFMHKISENSMQQNQDIETIFSAVTGILDNAQRISRNVDLLKQTINTVAEKGNEVTSLVEDTDRRTSHLLERTSAIREKITEMLTLAQEITKISQESDVHAREIRDMTENIVQFADEISKNITQSMEDKDRIREIKESISNDLKEMERKGEIFISKYGELVTRLEAVIDEVRKMEKELSRMLEFIDDTNILAMNAWIIASQASLTTGQEDKVFGKDFEVVANEIKNLSKRMEEKMKDLKANLVSLDKELNSLKDSFQKDIGEGIEGIWEDTKKIGRNFDKVQETTLKLEETIESIKANCQQIITRAQDALGKIDNVSEGTKEIEERSEKLAGELKETLEWTEKTISQMQEVKNRITSLFSSFKWIVERVSESELLLRSIKNETEQQDEAVVQVNRYIDKLRQMIKETFKLVYITEYSVKTIAKYAQILKKITDRYKVEET